MSTNFHNCDEVAVLSDGSHLEIRAASFDDWPVIAEFNRRLAFETEGKQLDPVIINEGVKSLLQQPEHGRYFLACRHGAVVGQMMHTREWSDWRNGEIWWLQSVYVHEDVRRLGVFRSLFAHVEKLARESPTVVGLRLYVEENNSRAQEAYVRLGLKKPGYTVMEQIFRNEV